MPIQLPTKLPKFPPAIVTGLLSRLPKLPIASPPKLTFHDVVMADPASKQYSLEANALLQPGKFTPGRGVVEASFVLGNNSGAPVDPSANLHLNVLRGNVAGGAASLPGSAVSGSYAPVGTIPAHSLSSRVSTQAALPADVVANLQNGDVIQAYLLAFATDNNGDTVVLGQSDTYQWTVGGVVAPPPPANVTPGLQGVDVTISSVEGPMGAVKDVGLVITREQ